MYVSSLDLAFGAMLFEDLFEESDNTEAALAEEITLGGA